MDGGVAGVDGVDVAGVVDLEADAFLLGRHPLRQVARRRILVLVVRGLDPGVGGLDLLRRRARADARSVLNKNLEELPGQLRLQSAKEIAKPRIALLQSFLQELDGEALEDLF